MRLRRQTQHRARDCSIHQTISLSILQWQTNIELAKMEEENELIALRRKKVETLRARGIEPCGKAFQTSGDISGVREKFKEGETLRAAGRITAHRDMGQSHFLDLRDATGRIQVYIQAKEVGPELMDLVPLLDLGA